MLKKAIIANRLSLQNQTEVPWSSRFGAALNLISFSHNLRYQKRLPYLSSVCLFGGVGGGGESDKRSTFDRFALKGSSFEV